eukprot:scaffold221557_cov61-Cyclotella_meneghiniana.AAC.1
MALPLSAPIDNEMTLTDSSKGAVSRLSPWGWLLNPPSCRMIQGSRLTVASIIITSRHETSNIVAFSFGWMTEKGGNDVFQWA